MNGLADKGPVSLLFHLNFILAGREEWKGVLAASIRYSRALYAGTNFSGGNPGAGNCGAAGISYYPADRGAGLLCD